MEYGVVVIWLLFICSSVPVEAHCFCQWNQIICISLLCADWFKPLPELGPRLNIRTFFLCMGIYIVNIRRSWDRFIVTMGIPTLVWRHLYIDTDPCVGSLSTRPWGKMQWTLNQTLKLSLAKCLHVSVGLTNLKDIRIRISNQITSKVYIYEMPRMTTSSRPTKTELFSNSWLYRIAYKVIVDW